MKDSDVTIPTLTVKTPLGRAATLHDVAQIAGVSQVAASVVLNNNSRSRVKVSEATRQRILDAARELKYQPNAIARSLRGRKTNVIGFYGAHGHVFNPLYPFHANLLKGLMDGCKDHRKNFLIHGLYPTDNEDEIYQELLNGQLEGLVLYAREMTPLIERLISSHLPVVTIANEVPDVPSVTIDNDQGGRMMARYLSEKGYRKVFYRSTEPVLPSTLQTRYQSFKAEGEALGLDVELFSSPPITQERFHIIRDIIAASPEGPPVIACYTDFNADGFTDICRINGVRVPEEVAITGFDGFLPSKRPAPLLTTIRAPWDEVARKAVELLIAQCNGETVPLRTYFPVELIAGETA